MAHWPIVVVGATLFVAYANGANDNFKGVATLFGSGTTDYRKALGWATVTTLAGSLAAFFLAGELISIFQGKGLLPAQLSESEPFVAAVVLGAALTVMFATKIGMPISTTHSLTGALLGGALVAAGFDLGFRALAINVFVPLLVSPLCAVALATFGFPLLRRALRWSGLNRENCLCVGAAPSMVTAEGVVFVETTPGLRVIVDREAVCAQPQAGTILGITGREAARCRSFSERRRGQLCARAQRHAEDCRPRVGWRRLGFAVCYRSCRCNDGAWRSIQCQSGRADRQQKNHRDGT